MRAVPRHRSSLRTRPRALGGAAAAVCAVAAALLVVDSSHADGSEGAQGASAKAYARARAREAAGDDAGAAAAYAKVGEDVPEAIRTDVAHRLARIDVRRGRCNVAEPTLRAWEKSDAPDAALGRALAGHCALRLGRPDDAIRLLGLVTASGADTVDPVALALDLSAAHAAKHDAVRAESALRTVALAHPEHPHLALLEAAARARTGHDFLWTDDERIARADRLTSVREHEKALAELDRVGRPANKARLAAWLHVRGMALYRMRGHYAEAAKDLEEAAKLGGPTALVDAYHAARSVARTANATRAVRAYDAFTKAFPGNHKLGLEAELLAGIEELSARRTKGRRRLEKLVERVARGHGDIAQEAEWRLALDEFERGSAKRAVARFAHYATLSSDILVRGRGLYWEARALEASKDRAGAAARYREVIALEPIHWYALLAKKRLEALGESVPPPFAADRPDTVFSKPKVTLPEAVRFYLALGLDADARAELRAVDASLRAAAPKGTEDSRMLAIYAEVGEWSRAQRLGPRFARVTARAPTGDARWVWEALYPRPFARALHGAAVTRGVPPDLLYSLMRQESGYDPTAVSYADARGLLQLIPPTAARMAEGLGAEISPEELFSPEPNILLGATYVAKLLGDFEGTLPLAIAGYNAGEHNVTSWLKATKRMELDRWVEHIPASQTRNYVRRVTTHYAHYMALAAGDGSWPDVPLPDEVAPIRAKPRVDDASSSGDANAETDPAATGDADP